MIGFAHIINGVSKNENEALYDIQKLTIASFKKAKEYSSQNIQQYVCGYKDFKLDFDISFKQLPPISTSIKDIFPDSKNYVFLKDVLQNVVNHSTEEYIIYSNADIGLMPNFYEGISAYIHKGYDGIVVNRRRIKSTLNKVSDLEFVYSEIGKSHLGFDMFIFKREAFKNFILNNTCVGIPYVGNDLFYNIFTFSNKPILLADHHLTFHIGMELVKNWGSKELQNHNYKEFKKAVDSLLPKIDINKFPGAELSFWKRHFKWLMNPTFSYPIMLKADFRKQKSLKPKKSNYDPHYKVQKYYEWLLKWVNFND